MKSIYTLNKNKEQTKHRWTNRKQREKEKQKNNLGVVHMCCCVFFANDLATLTGKIMIVRRAHTYNCRQANRGRKFETVLQKWGGKLDWWRGRMDGWTDDRWRAIIGRSPNITFDLKGPT